MKFLTAWSKSKIGLLSLGVLLAAGLIALSFNISSAAGDSKEVPVGKTIERDGVAVTLESLKLGETETQLTYSYSSKVGSHVEPLGLRRITLPNGKRLKSQGGGVLNGAGHTGSMTVELAAIPEGTKTISVDLSSFILYTSDSALVEIPLGGEIKDIDPESITERQSLPLDILFSVGPARYRFTTLLLDPSNFVLVYEPVNAVASRTVLGGGLSRVRLDDDRGGTYFSFLTGADWDQIGNNGHTVGYQGLYFDGLPNPDATTFSLRVEGTGEIKAPYIFQVELP